MKREFNAQGGTINRFEKNKPFDQAVEAAKKFISRPFIDQSGDGKNVVKIKDILVTLPDNAVYLNTKSDEIIVHAQRKGLQIVEVMRNGKLMNEVEEDPEFEAKQKAHLESLKKRAKKVGLPESATEEEILDAEKAKRK